MVTWWPPVIHHFCSFPLGILNYFVLSREASALLASNAAPLGSKSRRASWGLAGKTQHHLEEWSKSWLTFQEGDATICISYTSIPDISAAQDTSTSTLEEVCRRRCFHQGGHLFEGGRFKETNKPTGTRYEMSKQNNGNGNYVLWIRLDLTGMQKPTETCGKRVILK